MTSTVNTVLLYMGCGRYVPGALAVATECLCVLGPNLCLGINSWESIRSEACLAFASLGGSLGAVCGSGGVRKRMEQENERSVTLMYGYHLGLQL